jgi:hypothetical protein
MKPREPRRSVMLSARMRLGACWGSARILNISSRGMLLESTEALSRGTYVEVCRGRYRVVARVVWNRDNQCGLVAQDPLPIDAIISEPDKSKGPPPPANDAAAGERRSAARARDARALRFERSRSLSQGLQFAAIAAFGASAAIGAYATVRQSLACPILSVTASLSGEAVHACATAAGQNS